MTAVRQKNCGRLSLRSSTSVEDSQEALAMKSEGDYEPEVPHCLPDDAGDYRKYSEYS